MRGEYSATGGIFQTYKELPPRARRIPTSLTTPGTVPGTTSACAENTTVNTTMTNRSWNYLRVRGEYETTIVTDATRRELPPRARRIPLYGDPYSSGVGTTSACAENTFDRIE